MTTRFDSQETTEPQQWFWQWFTWFVGELGWDGTWNGEDDLACR